MDVEVPYLFTRYRPSDIRVRIRPGQDMHFEDSGANGFELPGAAPSADTAFKDVAYDVTIAATQTFNNGQYSHSIATRGPGTRVRRRKPPSRARSRGTGRPSRTCNRSLTAAPSSWCWPSNRQGGRTPQCRGWSTCGSSRLRGPRPPSARHKLSKRGPILELFSLTLPVHVPVFG